jgi:septum formation protein
MKHKIILASQSPRRKQLLELAGIEFEVVVANTDESFDATMPITEIPIYIAEQKANKVFETHKENTIIAADTIVVVDNTILGKPINRIEAIEFLSKLSNNVHKVITGVVIKNKHKMASFNNTTIVSFCKLTIEQIEYYVDECKPYDKAGAYAIQEWIGAIGIYKIDGDFYNVMGLPISQVVKELEDFN